MVNLILQSCGAPSSDPPAQHELGVLVHVLMHQVAQQRFHDVGEVLQLVVQCHGEQRGHVAAVALREALLGLQRVDELQEEAEEEEEGWGRDNTVSLEARATGGARHDSFCACEGRPCINNNTGVRRTTTTAAGFVYRSENRASRME